MLLGPAIRSSGLPLKLFDSSGGSRLPDGSVLSLAAGASSLRRHQILPRKLYPVDPGLIPLYKRSGHINLGHALETAARWMPWP